MFDNGICIDDFRVIYPDISALCAIRAKSYDFDFNSGYDRLNDLIHRRRIRMVGFHPARCELQRSCSLRHGAFVQ